MRTLLLAAVCAAALWSLPAEAAHWNVWPYFGFSYGFGPYPYGGPGYGPGFGVGVHVGGPVHGAPPTQPQPRPTQPQEPPGADPAAAGAARPGGAARGGGSTRGHGEAIGHGPARTGIDAVARAISVTGAVSPEASPNMKFSRY